MDNERNVKKDGPGMLYLCATPIGNLEDITYRVLRVLSEADVTMIPQTYVELTDPQALKDLNRTLDLLDDDDDVQYVYTNLDE